MCGLPQAKEAKESVLKKLTPLFFNDSIPRLELPFLLEIFPGKPSREPRNQPYVFDMKERNAIDLYRLNIAPQNHL